MRSLRRALVLGAALGVAYTGSPLTIAFALVIVPVCGLAIRELGVRERRWVGAALVAAIGARVLAIAALLVATNPMGEQFRTFFPDAQFVVARSWWIRNLWLGLPIGPSYTDWVYRPYGESSFTYILAFIQTVFGLAPYGVNLISVGCFIAGSLLLFRLARRSYGPAAAVAGLLLLLAWPTFFAWSVSVLRESTQFFFVALVFVCTVAAVRHRHWTDRVLAIVAAGVALYALATLREGILIIVVLGLAFGLTIRLATLRWWIAALALLALVVAGPGLIGHAGIRGRVTSEVQLAASRHLGHVEMRGGSFRLLDERFYWEGKQAPFTMSFDEGIRFLLRSAAASVLVPLPWQIDSISGLAELPQQCLWYLTIAGSVVGFGAALRRDALVSLMLAGYILAGLMVITPNNGNIGTLVRHRDMVVPALVWLAGAGLCSMMAKAAPSPFENIPSRLTAPAVRQVEH